MDMGGRLRHGQLNVDAGGAENRRKPRTFEAWLTVDRLGDERLNRRVPLRIRALYDNLLHAREAPYPDREKADVLRDLYCSTQPQKSLLVLKALHKLAARGSPEAGVAFEQLSSRWLGDECLKCISLRTWEKGVRFVLHAQKPGNPPVSSA